MFLFVFSSEKSEVRVGQAPLTNPTNSFFFGYLGVTIINGGGLRMPSSSKENSHKVLRTYSVNIGGTFMRLTANVV